ncbi:N-6 DNA methylase [Streptomyces sp. NPDC049949]|uniref:HsdM family class I SAM-dependent methyltransferase n=1 Tax=Streptomyces sp. NPDC049949 TaxID=3154627 RepID=UPI003424EBFD
MGDAQRYTEYTNTLRQLASDAATGLPVALDQLRASIDGEASAQLRRLVPLDYRRKVGAFFTPAPLKERVASLIRSHKTSVYLDPTCGSGDLLLAASSILPTGATLRETLEEWTHRLHGYEINEEFVAAARYRLVIAAMLRHGIAEGTLRPNFDFASYFSNIIVADGLARLSKPSNFDGHILLNPPFGTISADARVPWTVRPTSAAAVFTYHAMTHLSQGGRMTAILPDVLRSGSRYRSWREQMDTLGVKEPLVTYGQFDEHADVDVFLLAMKAAPEHEVESRSDWWASTPTAESAGRVDDRFTVRVGSVVDNRDPLEGPEYPFARAKDLPASGEMSLPGRKRRFAGTVFKPPFVLIRRTSRPTIPGQTRVSGVLVTGKRSISVDNHLIVAMPRDGAVDSCRDLLEVLACRETTEWLDNRIRCRHLTVGAVRDIPWTVHSLDE